MQMANSGQRESEHSRNCIVGDSWFSSIKLLRAYMNVAMNELACQNIT